MKGPQLQQCQFSLLMAGYLNHQKIVAVGEQTIPGGEVSL